MKHLFLSLALSFGVLINCMHANTFAWEAGGDETDNAGTYTASINAYANNKVKVSITLNCINPSDDQACTAVLFRSGNDSNAGVKYQTGAMGKCDAGGVFETSWEIEGRNNDGIKCGKGGGGACTNCLFLQLSCADVLTGLAFIPEPKQVVTGDCP